MKVYVLAGKKPKATEKSFFGIYSGGDRVATHDCGTLERAENTARKKCPEADVVVVDFDGSSLSDLPEKYPTIKETVKKTGFGVKNEKTFG